MPDKYVYEGSTGGYPYSLDEGEAEYYEFVCSHHDCSICGDKNVSEEMMYKTSMGWMHTDCYDEIVINAAEDGSEIPELL
ncbi:MAG: hypothetical protein WC998_09730 [Candidatus Paceibacterota bacterium]|jgi:hypothetical protein